MRTLLVSAFICLGFSISSFSQNNHYLWLQGKITQSDRDSVKCDIYMWSREVEEWAYMITYTFGDTYAVSFDYPEHYVLIFSDSNTEYELYVHISEKSFEIVNIALDTDIQAVLECPKHKPDKYLLSLLD